MLKQGTNHSPSAKTSGHETTLRQKSGNPSTTFWWDEDKPKGGRVDDSPTRSETGSNPKTIGPRVA